MKIALAQMDVLPNQPEKNLETMLLMIDKAKKHHAKVIAFPEMCVSGYLVGDKFTSDEYCEDLMSFNETLRKASDGITIIYGNVYVDHADRDPKGKHPNKDGRTRKYNAAYIFQDQKPVPRANKDSAAARILPDGVQPKTLLPNYRFFDDMRYFFSTIDIANDFGCTLEELIQPFEIKDENGKSLKIGLEVCEDLWCEDYRKDGEALNVTRTAIDNGAELIVNISTSPWTYGKNNARDRRIMFLKNDSQAHGQRFKPFLYVNCTGAQNNGKNIVTLDGGTTAYNSDGQPVLLDRGAYLEDLLMIDSDSLDKSVPLMRIEKSRIAQKYDAIIRGIRHTKDMMGIADYPKFVLGLSGGVDSAVVAALLCQAVGKDKVIGINMPSRYNSDKTINAASYIKSRLGIRYGEIPIQRIVDTIVSEIEGHDLDGSGKVLSELNLENLQAKIRGTDILSNIAAKYGAIFTNNGNKLEVALGYATLYGDVGGAIAPIADLTKEEVFQLARYLNKEIYHDDIIPEILLPDDLFRFRKDQIQPSAELKNNQVDPMKFGYHDRVLEAFLDYNKKGCGDIMEWYLDGTLAKNLGISDQLIARWGLDDPKTFVDDLLWFDSQIMKNVFKRVQSPPIIITSKTAFGYDDRESMLAYRQSSQYKKLKKKVLEMQRYESRAAA